MIHFIFDVDNTLTPARQPMTPDFAKFFSYWIIGKNVHLISGSDIEKIKEQVPDNILMGVNSVHACSGNQVWVSSYNMLESKYTELKCIHEEQWWPGDDLIWVLNEILDESVYPLQTGNHIEKRVGVLNFSIAGRNSTKSQRDTYEKWDSGYGERKAIVARLLKDFPNLDCAIGGQISIDIYPKGKDKSQIIEYMKEVHYIGFNIVFFGDKCISGNDKTLAKSIVKNELGSFHNVKDYTETLEILRNFYDNNQVSK